MSNPKWLDWAKRIQAIGQIGETYTKDEYDRERFGQLRELAGEIIADYTHESEVVIQDLFLNEAGYQTPKIDVRGVVFRDDRVLLVEESADPGKWTLPGGWADIQISPSENAAKEVFEESGYKVAPVRLLAVWDRDRQGHPPSPWHIYKLFFECEIIGGEARTSHETSGVDFFSLDNLPPLSVSRTTETELKNLAKLHLDPNADASFD